MHYLWRGGWRSEKKCSLYGILYIIPRLNCIIWVQKRRHSRKIDQKNSSKCNRRLLPDLLVHTVCFGSRRTRSGANAARRDSKKSNPSCSCYKSGRTGSSATDEYRCRDMSTDANYYSCFFRFISINACLCFQKWIMCLWRWLFVDLNSYLYTVIAIRYAICILKIIFHP